MERFNCTRCPSNDKACRSPEGKGPEWCPTKTEEETVAAGMEEYRAPEVMAFARAASLQEAECYAGRDEEKVRIGEFESMCNPISQAGFLNRAKTDFNIMLGLCIGHDSLFLRNIEGLTTVFAVKDRVTGHNPLAALYTSRSYYQRLAKPRRGDSAPGDEGK
ncbi:MAG: DUF1847 domain-containing protein [Desulfobacteria bacterium]